MLGGGPAVVCVPVGAIAEVLPVPVEVLAEEGLSFTTVADATEGPPFGELTPFLGRLWQPLVRSGAKTSKRKARVVLFVRLCMVECR